MTREINYIIENKKFKKTWDDYLPCWEFLIPILAFAYGLELTIRGQALPNYFVGSSLILGSILLVRFALLRKRQLIEFEEVANKMIQEENFNLVLEGLRKISVVEVDNDIHSWTINAKYKTTFLPPFFEWLTIVCLDNRVLINSRPSPVTIVFWIRRNAVMDVKKFL